MSKYAKELNRRILSGEPVHITREWYLKRMSKERNLYFSDLSEEEQKFLSEMANSFFLWQWQKDRH